jgi:hypothetical protein
MQSIIVLIDKDTTRKGRAVQRWVCNRGHPHPTSAGAQACETARANGATDAELAAMLEDEITAFNAV